MIDIIETDSGVTISLKVQPNAKKNAIIGEHGNLLKIAVTAVPEKGKANKAVIDMLAKKLKIKKSRVSVVAGLTTREKKVYLEGISLDNFKLILSNLNL